MPSDKKMKPSLLQKRYELVSVLGQGGMGTVHMARDQRLDNRACVVKQLRDDFYRDEDRLRAQGFFEREARMLSRLRHPNIVQVFDFFCEEGKFYLVMDYVEGQDLQEIMQSRQNDPFSEEQVVAWSMEVCEVLDYLHSQNPPVVYRDLKPSNIMIDTQNRVKLVDFGIARPIENESENTHVISAGYSPPEQYWGGANPASDIYALGATMFFLLTGQDPEPLKQSSPRELNPDVSEYLDELIQKATSHEIAQRFANVQEMREALLNRDFVAAPQTPKSKLGEIAAAFVFIVILCAVFSGALNFNIPQLGLGSAPDSKSLNPASTVNEDVSFGGTIPQKGLPLKISDEREISAAE